MKQECNIIRDILPLYVEDMVCDDTADFVKEHLAKCPECQRESEQLKEPEKINTNADAAPLVSLKRKLWKKKVQTICFTSLIILALAISAFAVLSTPVYFPYSEDLLSVTENADKSITITFDPKVTGYSCESYSEGEEAERYYYNIEAWTSLWDEWFSNRGVQATTIQPKEDLPFMVYYVSNDNSENVCIYNDSMTPNGGVITLQRLSLGYYLLFAVLFFCVLLGIRFATRRKDRIKIWIEYIMLYPVSYIFGHFIVVGSESTTYSMQRDFTLIIFVSIILYCASLLARSIYGLRKEINSF